jgi:nicotinamidase-related amidase
MFHPRKLLPLTAVAVLLLAAAPLRAQTIIDEWPGVKAPAAPKLESVTLDPKKTALLVIDLIKQTCNAEKRPRCVASVPKIEKLLAAARASGVTVIYTLFPSPSPATFPDPKIGDYVPSLAPKGGEPVVTSLVDKFILGDKDTGLQKILQDRGITTIITVGAASHNGVLFTAVAAALRGFRVVVPVDGMSGNNAYEDQAAAYIMTTSIVYKITLTTTDMIKFE